MIGQRGIARPVVRILTDPARAEDATIAHLQQTTFEMIGHGFPLFFNSDCS
jgi:hypothetical protein